MADGIYTALTGAVAQQHSLDVIANNVANVTTAGFRADRAAFSEFLAGAQKSQQPSVSATGEAPVRPDHFVHVDAVSHDFTGGALKLTGNPLDLALSGDGFFAVQTPQGERLTRAGSFMMQRDGTLSTAEGYPVLSVENKTIKIPAGGMQFGPDGSTRATGGVEFTADGFIQVDGMPFGKLKLVRAENPLSLAKESATHFVANPESKLVAAKDVTVTQGHLEASNVNAVAGLNDLITVSRSFDALQRVIETFQKMDERAARDLGSRG